MTDKLRDQTLDEAKRLVSSDRNEEYGEPIDNFTKIVEALNALGYRGPGGRDLTPHDLPIIQIVTKLSRLAHSPRKADSWVDISGYAAVGREVSEKQQPAYASGGLVKPLTSIAADSVSVNIGNGGRMLDFPPNLSKLNKNSEKATEAINDAVAEEDAQLLKEHSNKIIFKWLPSSTFGGLPSLRMALPWILARSLSMLTIHALASDTAFASKIGLDWRSEKKFETDGYTHFVWEGLPQLVRDTNA